MNFRQAIILAVLLGLSIGVLIAMITELHDEREFVSYVYEPLDETGVPAPEVSALIEEARRITREASGD